MTHYETLGVDRDADADTIKAAWRRKASAAHPDRKGGSKAAMQAVQEAYDCLSDAEKRAAYDAGEAVLSEAAAQEAAADLLRGMFSDCIRDRVLNVPTAVAIRLAADLAALEHDLKRMPRARKNLQRWRNRIGRKTAGENLFDAVLADKLREVDEAIHQTKQICDWNRRAAKMLAEYEDAGEGFSPVEPESEQLQIGGAS